jgi:hypothetical protein
VLPGRRHSGLLAMQVLVAIVAVAFVGTDLKFLRIDLQRRKFQPMICPNCIRSAAPH